MSTEKRAWLYRVLLALGLLAVGYGVVSDSELPLWVALVSALLGTGTATAYTGTGTATAYTPRHRAGANDAPNNG